MKFILAFIFTLTSAQCFAAAPPPPPPTASYDATASGSSKNDTRVYAGFGLAFGVKTVFETMIGIQSAHVNSSGNVSGANISASIPLTTSDSVSQSEIY